VKVELLEPGQRESALPGLADVLVDSVDGGASVGFLESLTRDEAEQWWAATLHGQGVRTWVARGDDGSVVGCVLLATGTPDNARHRAEVRKLLVHRRARGAGVATALMDAVEQDAVDQGRTLLLLDTESGSPAETLYRGRGWQVYGRIADHARTPDGQLKDTTFMTKNLA
jgi:acetyltransferase